MFNFNKLAGIAARHIIQVLLQSSEAAQVTEIAITGKASGSNVDRLKMTVSWRLNVGHFSFYSFKLRLSLHVIVAITLCRFHLPSPHRIFLGCHAMITPPPPPSKFLWGSVAWHPKTQLRMRVCFHSSRFNYNVLMMKKSFTQPPSVVNHSSTAQIGVEQCPECYCLVKFCSLVSFCPRL